MGNKPGAVTKKISSKYKNVDNDLTHSGTRTNTHTPLPGQTILTNKHYSGSGHNLPSINSTRSSFSTSNDRGHRLSFTASNSTTLTSFNYDYSLPPLQNRIDDENVLYLIIMYMDILSRLQISLCCKYFNKIILSEKCLSDVWIIHGLTHKKYLWEVPIPNTQRYHRKIRSHSHHHSSHHLINRTKSTSALSPPSTNNNNTNTNNNNSSSSVIARSNTYNPTQRSLNNGNDTKKNS